jgi:hypothetical protein
MLKPFIVLGFGDDVYVSENQDVAHFPKANPLLHLLNQGIDLYCGNPYPEDIVRPHRARILNDCDVGHQFTSTFVALRYHSRCSWRASLKPLVKLQAASHLSPICSGEIDIFSASLSQLLLPELLHFGGPSGLHPKSYKKNSHYRPAALS